MARIHSKKHRAAEAAKAQKAAARACLEQTHTSQCPNCGKRSTAYILYGLPSYDDELRQDLDGGLIVLGGCDLIDGQPKFFCNTCQHKWGSCNFAERDGPLSGNGA